MAKRRHKARPARFALVLVLAALVVAVLALVAGSSTASSSAAPTNTSRPTISGTAREGQTLTGSTGTWSGTQPISYSYQWHRCSSSVSDGHAIRVRVTAKNSAGSATATSVPTAVIKKPAGPPPKPATGCPPGNGPVSVAKVTAPARLNVDRTSVTPDPVGRSTRVIVARFHVSDTCRQSVGGALVYVTAVPFNQFTIPAEQPTDANGNVTVEMSRLRGYPAARHQQLLVLFVRARKPGDPLLGGISTRRLVSTAV